MNFKTFVAAEGLCDADLATSFVLVAATENQDFFVGLPFPYRQRHVEGTFWLRFLRYYPCWLHRGLHHGTCLTTDMIADRRGRTIDSLQCLEISAQFRTTEGISD